jgi:hypothetical protein
VDVTGTVDDDEVGSTDVGAVATNIGFPAVPSQPVPFLSLSNPWGSDSLLGWSTGKSR